MPDHHEVTDSSDWLSTPLAPLAQLESSLRCQVCKDFFTTPMITSCSHTFCSLCIRRYLSQEGKCPACRESDQEIKLRRNWVVEELVTNFAKERSGLLHLAHQVGQARQEAAVDSDRPTKRRRIADNKTVVNGVERRSTRSQSKAISASQQSARSADEVIHDSEDEGSLYEEPQNQRSDVPLSLPSSRQPNDGKVACPCCGRRMKEIQINSHLDKCIAGDSHTPVEETTSSPPPAQQPVTAPASSIAYSKPKPAQHVRLPFINYSLLNDNAMRKKLRDLGIPGHGSKDLMRRRHTEWVNLWNANCDSTNPLSKRQLLQDLRVWEDTLGRQIEKAPPSGFMSKDFDRDRHVKIQKDNFDELIRQARAKRTTAPTTSSGDDNERDEKRDMNGQEHHQPVQGQDNAGSEDSCGPGPELGVFQPPLQLPLANPASLSPMPVPFHNGGSTSEDPSTNPAASAHQTLHPQESIDLTISPTTPAVAEQIQPAATFAQTASYPHQHQQH